MSITRNPALASSATSLLIVGTKKRFDAVKRLVVGGLCTAVLGGAASVYATESLRPDPGIQSTEKKQIMPKNNKMVPTAEYNAVIAVAQKYVDGLRSGSVEGVAEAFHKDAVMYGFTNGKLLGGSIRNLFDFVKQNGKAPDITTRLDVLAITPTTAVVRVDMEKDAIGADYNDYLTLIKIDGNWKVIAKVYHQFEG
ncbi:nuclear transport factor 2 family protein [Ralstonia wenshanensis]|uniref:Nuclear transport factor 2 family protein n=1 Tax=Ralstonia wenshanensis TaxID=2842456 RepID=A0AAD2EME4_9RALS|nr:nuclear transport factor 2 family protein [Ralstonia wenshanensis]CAJ0692673.1 hypothetical protein LMG18091_01651 [Ralstonia wenshanensis]